MLVRAYRGLPESIRRAVQLVISGPMGWKNQVVQPMLRDGGPHIRYLGYVPESDLPGLLGGATALVYPSRYEGFGLPVAQALAAGVPVITSNCSSLPEVTGDAGLLVDGDSEEELTDAMERVIRCSDLARDLASRGKERAKLFRWPECARQSLEFFREVAGL